MKLLLDANLSPRLVESLTTAGYAAIHVADLGLTTAPDSTIFDRAAADGLVVVTADSDFPMLLALRRATSPSVVHLRHVAELAPDEHAALLVANLPLVTAELERGAMVTASAPASGSSRWAGDGGGRGPAEHVSTRGEPLTRDIAPRDL